MNGGTASRPGLFELRFYAARPGRRDELARYMDEVVSTRRPTGRGQRPDVTRDSLAGTLGP